MATSPRNPFSGVDFVVLGLSFVISALIGIYFACAGKKQNNRETYFLGDRKMRAVPIALSLMATALSAVTFLGVPAEVYFFGPDLLVTIPGRLLAMFIIIGTVMPLYYRLRFTSIYEYLEMRFNKTVKIAGVCIFYAFSICYMGLVVYAPGLALSLVTGMSVVSSILIVTIVCIFYTTIGGMKAVIWSDVFQVSFLMMSGLVAIVIAAIAEIGSIKESVGRIAKGERLPSVNLSFDFTIRYTLYSSLCGGFMGSWTMSITGQQMIQRYLCCKTLNQAKIVAWLGFSFSMLVVIIAVIAGLMTYAYYAGCDPFLLGRIQRFDQIVPLIISDLFAKYPGLAGLIVSGAFSASLSTISSSLNSMSAIFEAVLLRKVFPDATDKKLTFFSKLSSIGFGLLCTAVALIATKLSGVLEETIALTSVIMTPLSAVFTLGFYVPRCNSKGALCALIAGILFGVWIKIGSELYPSPGRPPRLSVESCLEEDYLNGTSANLYMYYSTTQSPFVAHLVSTVDPVEETNKSSFVAFYNMSVFFYSLFTFLVSIIVGYVVSLATKAPHSKDPRLHTSILNAFLCRGDGSLVCKTRHVVEEEYDVVETKDGTDDVIKLDGIIQQSGRN
ncbi:Sodium-coupled monocarboxylate transporter 1 [Holothuria leucospilota]|uniref:Sodium-coupled monocarboxylate transporter 1 n=1 Tax=Holothuria leucospilota TaxID=206669 RepID=A0A9Q1H304_HOLLE|nr:Sodium-coupled monocarboxylate transporter 1 [Holothuria leucospilota]